MMIALNYVRTRANTMWRLFMCKESEVDEMFIRFKFEAILINKNVSMRSGKSFRAMRQQIKKY